MLAPLVISPRLDKLRQKVEQDALVVTSLTNIRYLTGFTGSAGMLFILPDDTVLLTDGRYESQAAEQIESAGAPVRVAVAATAKQKEAGSALVADHALQTLALEAEHVSWARQRAFESEWFPDAELVPTVGLVEQLRRVKDAGELDRLAEAASIADAALAALKSRLSAGTTEVEFGRALDFQMMEMGASGPSFETIVASGPNAAKPHHRPGGRTIGRGEPIVLDFGALFEGYCSDMTRTVWIGEVAEPELRRAVSVVLEAQAAGVAAVKGGVECSDVDRACRQVIADAGLGERFVHGTGHGVGLDIHEAPWVSATATGTLEPGNVVTIEPGVYLPGLGGVRIEDTVVVTGDGCRPLTSTPKDHP